MSGVVHTLVAEHAFLAGFPAEVVEAVAEVGEPVAFEPGALLFGEGSDADVAYLITKGHVAIEVHAPNRGPMVVDTVEAGHVLGLSWAAPPFRYQFDARALDEVEAVGAPAGRSAGRGATAGATAGSRSCGASVAPVPVPPPAGTATPAGSGGS